MELLKTLASFVMGTIGAWMLWRGKKTMDTKMMMWGGALIVLSYFLFSGGGGDGDSSKAALKTLVTPTPEQTPTQP